MLIKTYVVPYIVFLFIKLTKITRPLQKSCRIKNTVLIFYNDTQTLLTSSFELNSTLKNHDYFLQIFLATLPLMGVNKYGYQQWCDFFWNDTSPEGRFFVIIFLLQGNCSLLAAWRSERCILTCVLWYWIQIIYS